MWYLFKCSCWLIIEVILRNARCNNKVFLRVISAELLVLRYGLAAQGSLGNTAIHHTVTVLDGSGNIIGYIFVFRCVNLGTDRILRPPCKAYRRTLSYS